MRTEQAGVVITGAGPSGAVAAALLRQRGHAVVVLERETFPRFSIGESLLPQSMAYLEEAGMLRDVVEAGFQFKNGASFTRGALRTDFDFREKFTPGWGTTYQVQRARFDQVLADAAQRMGADLRYRHEVTAVDVSGPPRLTVRSEAGETYAIEAQLLLDASGFARLLPRLLDLERPSQFPVRQAYFTHLEDRIPQGSGFDRNKIRIAVHPDHQDVWYWVIPFSDGRCSVGVVAEPRFLEAYPGNEATRLRTLVDEDPNLHDLLGRAVWDTPVRSLKGYSANVKHLFGPWLGPIGIPLNILMFLIEIVGHLARPISLSLRLMANIFADHLVLAIFASLLPWFIPLPVLPMLLGTMVVIVQTLVFCLLSTVYIGMAIETHDHGHDDHAHDGKAAAH